VADPCRTLLREHEATDHTLEVIRSLTNDYRAPAESTEETLALYRALADYDRALVHHMHLEGNVLFPRARQLETKTRSLYRRRAR
jgi:regulator of cell morphogenesis and NO signaling